VGLVRSIRRWDLTAAIVNGVIGSGIFGLPGEMARRTGPWSPLVAFLGGLAFLAILLCFAEVASRFRDPGGPYLYAREAFGPFVGFEVGWLTFCTRVLSAAAALNVFALYLAELWSPAGTPVGRGLVMLGVASAMTVVNIVGVRQATWTINAFTLAKLLPLGLLILLGLPRVQASVLKSQAVTSPDWTGAFLLMVFAYGGFEAALIPASEARDPQRDTGFALLAALSLVATFYVLLQLVVVGVLPGAGAYKASIAAAYAALLGKPGVVLASLAAMLSVCGWATGSLLQSPRILFSMAERGEVPRVFGAVHPRFRTPHVAIVTYAAASLGFGLLGGFAWNAIVAAAIRLIYYGLTCVALLVLRRGDREPPAFRVPGAIAPVGAAFCFLLLAFRVGDVAGILLSLTVAGVVLFALGSRLRARSA
jgi:amino acid transporter